MGGMVELVLNADHLDGVLGEALATCRHRLFIATADLKDVHVPVAAAGGPVRGRDASRSLQQPETRIAGRSRSRAARSIIVLLDELAGRGVEVRVLHSGVPSGPVLQELKRLRARASPSRSAASAIDPARPGTTGPGDPAGSVKPAGPARAGTLTIRRCPRVHAKAVVVDGVRMYLGSANLTGAGLGAKSERRRNFEAGVWTDELRLIDPVLDMLHTIWTGSQCPGCGRREYCPAPLEEPGE